jgi:hypothetical protein
MNTAVDMVSLTASVKHFDSQARQALIDGRWQDAQSGETFEVFNPANESVIARVADCKRADVDLAGGSHGQCCCARASNTGRP